MRVLHVIPSLSPERGGASKAALDMARALQQQGVDVEIACTNDDGDGLLDVPLDKHTEYAGLNVRFFARYSPPLKPVREFAYSASFARWLRDHIQRYDLLHVHALFSYLPTRAMQIARQYGVPYIAHPIGSLEFWSLEQRSLRKRVFLRLFEQANLQQAAAVHFTADSERDQAMQRVTGLKPLVIPLGLDPPALLAAASEKLRQQYSLGDDDLVLLFLGRLHEKKGLESLFEAMADADDDRLMLLIAGAGERDYEASLKARVSKLGLQEQCRFIGYVQGAEKKLLLQGADLFVLTSFAENFGVAVLESMASRTPVLLTPEVPLAGAVELLKMGFVCRPTGPSATDSAAAITSQLQSAIQQVAQLPVMGERAREYAMREHSWPALADQLVQAYEKSISPARSRASG